LVDAVVVIGVALRQRHIRQFLGMSLSGGKKKKKWNSKIKPQQQLKFNLDKPLRRRCHVTIGIHQIACRLIGSFASQDRHVA
jgi:hypothetical protein